MTARIHAARRIVVATTVAAALLLSGCGDDDDGDDATTTTEAPTQDATTTTTEPVEVEEVEVTLADYKFEGLPESVPVGTKLSVTNASTKEVHEMVVLRIPDDEKRSVEELVALPEAEADAIFGDVEPAIVFIAAPDGGTIIPAVGDGTITEAGRYAVVCFLPAGADPAEVMAAMEGATDGPPELPDGAPHATQGMFAELLVE